MLVGEKRYQKKITIHLLCLSIKRRFLLITVVFGVLSISSSICILSLVKRSFLSTSSLLSSQVITRGNYELAQNFAKMDTSIDNILTLASKDPILNEYVDSVNRSSVIGGIYFSEYTSDMFLFDVGFQSENIYIVKPMCTIISNYLSNSLNKTHSSFNNLTIVSEAGSPRRTSKEELFCLLSVLGSCVFSFVIAICYEYYNDTVYDAKDIQYMGFGDACEISVAN